jgi:GT2 family glycosyltransferase
MMLFSILIVSHNRYKELRYTLNILKNIIDFRESEVLVLLDNCTDQSELLIKELSWVKWHISNERLWASPARNELYKHAKGKILVGLDDDAHPLQNDFLQRTKQAFDNDKKLGIIAYNEIRGVFNTSMDALNASGSRKDNTYCSEFVGCGFAIKNDVYRQTRGFPLWMDIYCEEGCVAIETQALGYKILKANDILINHRVNKNERMASGRNYFRFRKQLRNEANFFIVYYPRPIKALLRLFWHNLKNYGLKDYKYFFIYVVVFFKVIFELPKTLKIRTPVKQEVIVLRRNL